MKVLAVDDDIMSLLAMQNMVRALGHVCHTAVDGDDAWRAYDQFHPDVIVSDWEMPGLSGSDLCRSVRSRDLDRYTYFIVVSGHDSPEDAVEGMCAGADDYLTKPLRIAKLRARLIAADRVVSLHARLDGQRSALRSQNRELITAASVDPLTGLGNRRSLDRDLEVLGARVERYGHSYCMSLVDIDYFKSFNDRYGHPAGDEALRAVAAQLLGQARGGDSLYRYGGDEFLCLFPEQSLSTASIAVERMRGAVADLGITHADSSYGVITLSAGVTLMDSDHPGRGSDVLREADKALYRAKEEGRNRVGSWDQAAVQ
jgi:two-component system chemotaxis response regulator CheY